MDRKLKISIEKPLGSGYDLEKDRESRRKSREALLLKICNDPNYRARDGKTFCNQAVQEDAKASGCDIFDGMLANDMVKTAFSNEEFTVERNISRVIEHVENGGFAFAGKEYHDHGHVASIFPFASIFSSAWDKRVPMVAHVGKPPNGVKGANFSFSIAQGEPFYFLWKVSEV